MALPEKYPKFPTLAERQNMIAQLKEAAEKGDALSSSQHFQNYEKFRNPFLEEEQKHEAAAQQLDFANKRKELQPQPTHALQP